MELNLRTVCDGRRLLTLKISKCIYFHYHKSVALLAPGARAAGRAPPCPIREGSRPPERPAPVTDGARRRRWCADARPVGGRASAWWSHARLIKKNTRERAASAVAVSGGCRLFGLSRWADRRTKERSGRLGNLRRPEERRPPGK